MHILYKYCSMAGVKILENRTIKVTPPNAFNDPFEFAVRSSGQVSKGFVRQILLDEDALRERFTNGDFEAFKVEQAALMDDPDWVATTIDQMTALHQDWAGNFVDQVSRNGGVVCLTRDKESILMWSHYANNHEGLMIGFDVDRLPYLQLFDVDYTNERPLNIDLAHIHEPEYLQQQFIAIMRRKSPVWVYEQEFRMQFHFSLCEHIPAIGMWFYHFEPEVIRSVHIGVKCAAVDRAHILSLLNKPHFAHVEVYQAKKGCDRYELIYDRLQ